MKLSIMVYLLRYQRFAQALSALLTTTTNNTQLCQRYHHQSGKPTCLSALCRGGEQRRIRLFIRVSNGEECASNIWSNTHYAWSVRARDASRQREQLTTSSPSTRAVLGSTLGTCKGYAISVTIRNQGEKPTRRDEQVSSGVFEIIDREKGCCCIRH